MRSASASVRTMIVLPSRCRTSGSASVGNRTRSIALATKPSCWVKSRPSMNGGRRSRQMACTRPGKSASIVGVVEERLAVLDHQILVVLAQGGLDQHGVGHVDRDQVGDHAPDVPERLPGRVLLLAVQQLADAGVDAFQLAVEVAQDLPAAEQAAAVFLGGGELLVQFGPVGVELGGLLASWSSSCSLCARISSATSRGPGVDPAADLEQLRPAPPAICSLAGIAAGPSRLPAAAAAGRAS